jgi:hypothetical protein
VCYYTHQERPVTAHIKRGLLLHASREVFYYTHEERSLTKHIQRGLGLNTYREVCYYTHEERCAATHIHTRSPRPKDTWKQSHATAVHADFTFHFSFSFFPCGRHARRFHFSFVICHLSFSIFIFSRQTYLLHTNLRHFYYTQF